MKFSLSRRGFLQTAGAGTVTMWIPNDASGYTAAEMREKAADGSLTSGSRNGSSIRRRSASTSTRWTGTWRRCGRSSRRQRRRQPAARQDAQVSGDCQAAARRRLDRRLHGEGQRGRGALRQRRREDPDDDLQRDGEQDPPRDEDSEGEPQLHPGGRQSPRMRRISPTPRRKPASSPTWSSTSRSARARACRQTSGRIALAQLVDKLPT